MSNGLVIAEVALSVMLLVGAALMMRTLVAMQDVDLGIRPERLMTMRVPLVETRYPDSARGAWPSSRRCSAGSRPRRACGRGRQLRRPPVCRLDDPDRGAGQRHARTPGRRCFTR